MAAINCMFMTMPMGIVFAPSDEEIIGCFLKNLVIEGPRMEHPLGCHIHNSDVYGYHTPWDIGASLPEGQKLDYYVFTKTNKLTVGRNKRTTQDDLNTWKGQSVGIEIISTRDGHVVVGEKKSFSFMLGLEKLSTHWTMHEYNVKMIDGVPVANDVDGSRWVICHLTFNKNYVKKSAVDVSSGGVVIRESAAVRSSNKKRKIPKRPECSNIAPVDAGGIQQQQLSFATTCQQQQQQQQQQFFGAAHPTAQHGAVDAGGIQQQQPSFATCQPTATIAGHAGGIMQQQQQQFFGAAHPTAQQQQQQFFGAAHPTAQHGAEAYSWNAFDTNMNGGMQQQQQQLYFGAAQPTASATTARYGGEESWNNVLLDTNEDAGRMQQQQQQQQQLSFATTCQPTATMAGYAGEIMQQQQQQQQFFGAAYPTAQHGAEYPWNGFNTNVNGGMQQQQQLYFGAAQPTASATTVEAQNEQMIPPPQSESPFIGDSTFELVQHIESTVDHEELPTGTGGMQQQQYFCDAQPTATTEEAQDLLPPPQSPFVDDSNVELQQCLESMLDAESTSTGIGGGEDGQSHQQMLENGSAEVSDQQAVIEQFQSDFLHLLMNDD